MRSTPKPLGNFAYELLSCACLVKLVSTYARFFFWILWCRFWSVRMVLSATFHFEGEGVSYSLTGAWIFRSACLLHVVLECFVSALRHRTHVLGSFIRWPRPAMHMSLSTQSFIPRVYVVCGSRQCLLILRPMYTQCCFVIPYYIEIQLEAVLVFRKVLVDTTPRHHNLWRALRVRQSLYW